MALSRSTIYSLVRDRIYNTGLGEKPSIRQTTGSSTVTGDLVDFDMATAQGDKLREGHVLFSYNPSDASTAYGFYVLSVSGDTVVALNGYEGAAIPTATSVGILEHQSPVAPVKIHNAIDAIVDGYLWPEVYDVEEDTVTANLTTFQSNADVRDERILRAWQYVGSTLYQVGQAKVIHNMPTSEFASGKMITYDVIVPGTIYYSAVRKCDLTNSTNTRLESLIALGASALMIEGTEAATSWETSKNDSKERRGTNPSRSMWQSFYQAKREFASQLAKDNISEWRVDRG